MLTFDSLPALTKGSSSLIFSSRSRTMDPNKQATKSRTVSLHKVKHTISHITQSCYQTMSFGILK